MESIALTAERRPRRTRQLPAFAALTALGVVYGDIGTSVLYGFNQAANAAGTISPDSTVGVVSVILWSLVLIVLLSTPS